MPVIKRYANRKLYDTDSKRYVTLDELADLVRRGEEVRVVDHTSGEDLTSVTLMQVIFEEEKKIGGMMPQVFLTRLIRSGSEAVSALRSRVGKIDPFQLVNEEIRRRIERLVRDGQLEEDEGARIFDLLSSAGKETSGTRLAVVDEELTEADAPVDLAQVEALEQQVQMLEQELAKLKRA